MKDLVVEYKWLGLIPFRWKRTIPEQWDEVKPPQLITLAKLYMEEINDMQTVASFYQIPKILVRWMPEYYIFTLITELDFISDFQPCNRFMIKSLAGLESPRPRLESMSFGQFIFADTYFEEYVDGANPESLHKGVGRGYQMQANGMVMRVAKNPPKGDVRRPVEWFNPIINARTPQLANDIARVNADAALNAARMRIN